MVIFGNYAILVTYIDVAWFQEIGKFGVQVFGQWNISKHPIRNVEKLKITTYLLAVLFLIVSILIKKDLKRTYLWNLFVNSYPQACFNLLIIASSKSIECDCWWIKRFPVFLPKENVIEAKQSNRWFGNEHIWIQFIFHKTRQLPKFLE